MPYIYNLFNIGSGNGLVSDGTKPSPYPSVDLSSVRSFSHVSWTWFHRKSFVKTSTFELCSKLTYWYVRFKPYLPHTELCSLWVQLTIPVSQDWLRYWLGAKQTTSHYLNQWWHANMYASCSSSVLRLVTKAVVENICSSRRLSNMIIH